MHTDLALSLCRGFQGDHCLFGYSGDFPDEHSARLIELAAAVSPASGSAQALRGRLGYVMVEAFQNIVRHRADTEGMAPWGDARSLFMLHYGQDWQLLVAENAVTAPQKNKLDGLLNGLRGRTLGELKELFMAGMQRTSVPGVRGAGLGLIEMVRRSGGRVGWGFLPIDDAHYRFKLELVLSAPPAIAGAALGDDDMRGMAMQHQWSLFFCGKWSPEVQAILLKVSGADASIAEQVDRLGTWLVHATPSFLVVHGEAQRVLSFGGLMLPEAARLTAERSGLDAGARLQLVPSEGATLVVAEMPLGYTS